MSLTPERLEQIRAVFPDLATEIEETVVQLRQEIDHLRESVAAEPLTLRWSPQDLALVADGSVELYLTTTAGQPALLPLSAEHAAALRDDLPVAGPATDAGYPPALPWASWLDDEDLTSMMDAVADATRGLLGTAALEAVEEILAEYRLIAECDHAQATAPGPDAEGQR